MKDLCTRRKNLIRYSKNFDKGVRIRTVIVNSKTGKMINDASDCYSEVDWKNFFKQKLEHKRLNDTYYFHNFEKETFIFEVSQYEDLYFFYGFFVKRNIPNRLQVLSILTDFISNTKGRALQHG